MPSQQPAAVVPLLPVTIESVIRDRAVRTLFQPIVHLATRSVVGFEALSRGPAGTSLESPMALIEAAGAAGLLSALDWTCRVHAMQAAAAADLHPGLSWFINVEPASLHDECPEHLVSSLMHARSGLRVVLEIVERDLNGHVTHLLHAADQARQDVWGVALDDVGSHVSSLALLPLLMPDVVKLDMSLVQSMPGPEAATVTAAVRAYAERSGAVVLAEGIETEAHERLARVFGATYGQGYLYGRPGQLPASVPAPRTVVPLRQRPAPLNGTTPFEVASAATTPERATKDLLMHVSRHLEERCETLREPFVLLASFQRSTFFTVRKRDRFRSLSALSALTLVIAEGLEPEQSPTFGVTGLQPGSRMSHEWVVVVLSASYTAAFVARDCGDVAPDAERRFDFVYTHDTVLATAIGRSFMQELVPLEELASIGAVVHASEPAAEANVPTQSRHGGLLRRYKSGR